MKKRPEVDWVGLRQASESIPDFVDLLTEKAKSFPQSKRVKAYRDVLAHIDPTLQAHIDEQVKKLVARGHDPARALRAATAVCMTARRRRLYYNAMTISLPEAAQRSVDMVMKATTDPKERARRIHKLIAGLQTGVVRPFPKMDAFRRLKEAGFSREEAERQIALAPRDEKFFRDHIEQWIADGMDPKAALVKGLTAAMRGFLIDSIMRVPVADGPDFCLSIVMGLFQAGMQISSAVQSSNAADEAEEMRIAAERVEATQRRRELTVQELETTARLVANETLKQYAAYRLGEYVEPAGTRSAPPRLQMTINGAVVDEHSTRRSLGSKCNDRTIFGIVKFNWDQMVGAYRSIEAARAALGPTNPKVINMTRPWPEIEADLRRHPENSYYCWGNLAWMAYPDLVRHRLSAEGCGPTLPKECMVRYVSGPRMTDEQKMDTAEKVSVIYALDDARKTDGEGPSPLPAEIADFERNAALNSLKEEIGGLRPQRGYYTGNERRGFMKVFNRTLFTMVNDYDEQFRRSLREAGLSEGQWAAIRAKKRQLILQRITQSQYDDFVRRTYAARHRTISPLAAGFTRLRLVDPTTRARVERRVAAGKTGTGDLDKRKWVLPAIIGAGVLTIGGITYTFWPRKSEPSK